MKTGRATSLGHNRALLRFDLSRIVFSIAAVARQCHSNGIVDNANSDAFPRVERVFGNRRFATLLDDVLPNLDTKGEKCCQTRIAELTIAG